MSKNTTTTKKPKFQSEAEEADWLHTEEGQSFARQAFRKAISQGKVMVRGAGDPGQVQELAKKTGRVVVTTKGQRVQPTNPAVLAKLLAEARDSMTKPISVRLLQSDIDRAKQIAEKRGIGYQTLMKELIHEGLDRLAG